MNETRTRADVKMREKRRVAAMTAVLSLAFFTPTAWSHIGSPNVLYQGTAGPYPVRVVIRPPGVIPGLAEISVRVDDPDPVTVTVLPVHAAAGREGAPPPDTATPVRGEKNLYSATLWLMTTGAYSVFVEVRGSSGSGTAIVPVNAVATRRLELPFLLGALLVALAVLLFTGALALVGAAVRESTLPPGSAPDPRRARRARMAVVVATLLLALALLGGKAWWDAVESDFRNNKLFRPLEVAAESRVEGSQRILRLDVASEEWRDWTPLTPDHGKLMHMFLLREPELDAFAHIHPIGKNRNTFEVAVPPLPAGTYRVYADVTHESGFAQTLTALVEVPEPPAPGVAPPLYLAPDPDDSWTIHEPFRVADSAALDESTACDLGGGHRMTWKKPDAIVAGREISLEFLVRRTDGEPSALEPYMGMLSHAAIRRDDGAVFAHLHPTGTISMASQQLFARREASRQRPGVTVGDAGAPPGHHAGHRVQPGRVTLPYEFPRSGRYRLWIQVKVQGQVLTGVFDTRVE